MSWTDEDRRAPARGADEASAFVDGALPADRARAIEARLARRDETARRIEDYRSQNAGLRSMFSAANDDLLPDRLTILTKRLERLVRRQRRLRAIARCSATVALCAAVGVAGYQSWHALGSTKEPGAARAGRSLDEPGAPSGVVRVGAMDFIRSVRGRPELETKNISALPIDGYALVGGEVLTTGLGPVVRFAYGHKDEPPLSLYLAAAPRCGEPALGEAKHGDVNLLSWCDHGMVMMLIGRLAPAGLMTIARALSPLPTATTPAPKAAQTTERAPADPPQRGAVGGASPSPKADGTGLAPAGPPQPHEDGARVDGEPGAASRRAGSPSGQGAATDAPGPTSPRRESEPPSADGTGAKESPARLPRTT